MADYIDALIDASNHRPLEPHEITAVITELVRLRTATRSQAAIEQMTAHPKVDPTKQVIVYTGSQTPLTSPLTIIIDPRKKP